jgi:hypothetical protein
MLHQHTDVSFPLLIFTLIVMACHLVRCYNRSGVCSHVPGADISKFAASVRQSRQYINPWFFSKNSVPPLILSLGSFRCLFSYFNFPRAYSRPPPTTGKWGGRAVQMRSAGRQSNQFLLSTRNNYLPLIFCCRFLGWWFVPNVKDYALDGVDSKHFAVDARRFRVETSINNSAGMHVWQSVSYPISDSF